MVPCLFSSLLSGLAGAMTQLTLQGDDSKWLRLGLSPVLLPSCRLVMSSRQIEELLLIFSRTGGGWHSFLAVSSFCHFWNHAWCRSGS